MKITSAIIAPTGGFGNHLRWLMLLDPSFRLNIPTDDIEVKNRYYSLKGDSWPDFESFSTDNVPHKILEEIKSYFSIEELSKSHSVNTTDPYEKIKFLTEHVYCKERTWQNWLMFEYKFRLTLDNLMLLEHNNSFDHSAAQTFNNVIIAQVDPGISLRAYVKFNSMLNFLTIEQYLDYIQDSNRIAVEYASKHKNVMLVDTSILFCELLDRDFYNSVTEELGLADCYDAAQLLHSIWFKLHKKAEVEMIENLKELFKGEL